jgi:hypothetical protein
MTDYLRIHDGVAVELWTAPVKDGSDLTPSECFAPDFAATFVPAAGGRIGMSTSDEGKTWTVPVLSADKFADMKSRLKAQIDNQAEAERLKLITPGSGQAMEYQESYAQARAVLSATDAVKASDYPMLAVTIGIDFDPDTGKPAGDVLGVARGVAAAYEAYLKAGAAIRGVRLGAKAEIEAAGDADLAQAVFAAVKWPAFG